MSPSILVSTSFFFYACSSSENKSSAALSIKEHHLREERSNRPLLSYHSSDSNGTTCPEVFLKASETGSSFTSFNTSDCIDRRCLNARVVPPSLAQPANIMGWMLGYAAPATALQLSALAHIHSLLSSCQSAQPLMESLSDPQRSLSHNAAATSTETRPDTGPACRNHFNTLY